MLPDLRVNYLSKLDTVAHVKSLLGDPDFTESSNGFTYMIYLAYADGPSSPMKPRVAFESDEKGEITRVAFYFEAEADMSVKSSCLKAFSADWKPKVGSDIQSNY
jgi:hypothetical protein